jgi:hypothetical protein
LTDTVGDALPREMARVRDTVMPAYIECGPCAGIALRLMRAELDAAARAIAVGDVVAMIVALKSLREFTL